MCAGQQLDARRSGWSTYQFNVSSDNIKAAIKKTNMDIYMYISAHKHTDGCNQNKNRDEENALWSYIMSLVTLHKQMRRGELPIPPPALEE